MKIIYSDKIASKGGIYQGIIVLNSKIKGTEEEKKIIKSLEVRNEKR